MTENMQLAKRQLRKAVQRILDNVNDETIAKQSRAVTAALLALPAFRDAKRISVFLSMPKHEIQTLDIASAVLQQGRLGCRLIISSLTMSTGKFLFVPRINASTMSMVPISSVSSLTALPRNKWGIPEPTEEDPAEEALSTGGLNLIVVPAVAFDRDMARLGHGKGYYDKYIKACEEKMGRRPLLVGLCLEEQVVEVGKIPMTDWDERVDMVVLGDGSVMRR
ncbi:5-formyltetrahydrofolate cyclo-ligase-like protein [Saitoella complicata NRRL Y-17804]|uniref:5-formyltetrahydrofolate cyclo-ligase-like protein n=1 Tax=Saitoella complicata (strain BCRC 22490 / CBS 7301 / JCM 7358 / NBRC 10748 / NRRL Y-17804) TaxID=698492 RepID=UPI000867202D|nr:5-formyltetrahydrofolate cyclo-ligase-like protein [Saitoella complicata NRRL Y-17804]ODQ51630.1 5-formyltetrahydrofolate cyclo-ligase-like protein [Saitoella complicata NRRL Y-17804]